MTQVLVTSTTLAASAGYGLMLSITRLSFEKIFKRESLRLIIEMTIYESLVASLTNLVVIFASGESRNLRQEMNDFLAIFHSWFNWIDFQGVFIVLQCDWHSWCANGTIFSVLFLHEKMSGVKVISMFLAMWVFLSYMNQHYLDDLENKAEKSLVREVS
ncbi:probable purine permease 10 [Solanum lycopersicum]|uniref:probable purine permease 10 n=1 Tax=Solanum lycopersicum TaxID=4081 RepID=UPI00374850E0